MWRCFCVSWLRMEGANMNVFMALPMRSSGWKTKSVTLMGCLGRGILHLTVVLSLIQLIPFYIIPRAGLVNALRSGLGMFICGRESSSWESQEQTCFLVNNLKVGTVIPVFFPIIAADSDPLSCACTAWRAAFTRSLESHQCKPGKCGHFQTTERG